MTKERDEEIFRLSPWGCLSAVLEDYGVDLSHITPKMGEHMVDDFMELMVRTGHVEKVSENE